MNPASEAVKDRIEQEVGELRREGEGRSLFRGVASGVLFYFRYSKIHRITSTPYAYFGLRNADIARLRGNKAFVCFVTDTADEDVFLLPFGRFEHLLREEDIGNDGQFKVNMYFCPGGVHALFSKRGSHAVDAYRGLSGLSALLGAELPSPPVDMTHDGMQSLLGNIGIQCGFDLWFPRSDISKVLGNIAEPKRIRDSISSISSEIDAIMQNIDVIWLDGTTPVSLFEVEHTTTIYSGLLRLCDVALTYAKINDFRIVARQVREEKFYREISRPTFRKHKLEKKVSFMSYDNAWYWHESLSRSKSL